MPHRTSPRGQLPLEQVSLGEVPPRARVARRPAKAAPRAAGRATSAAVGLVLRASPERLKLEALEKEHARLLREIEKRKLRCAATEQVSRDAHDTLHRETDGLRLRLSAALRELHEMFGVLLGPKSRLGRSDRAALRRFYEHVLGGFPPPSAFDPAPPAPSEEGDESPPAAGDGEPRGAPHPGEHASAAKPGEKNTGLLRALYKKLAVALHPDRARDPSEAARLTAVMKEVTRAYAEEDLAKLVELDRSWLVPSPEGDAADDLERRAAALLEANRELRRQLRALTSRLSELEEVLPGVARKGKRPPSAAEIAASTLFSLERELLDLERMRDAARELFAGRSGVFEFLTGRRTPADAASDPLGDPFDQMFDELLDAMAECARAEQRRKPRRR
jgi:hypothetical protein